MTTQRLDSEERRRSIVEAAVPLFARKGFAGTTTKEIAEAASISEALLFKHFPSKALLYREILRRGCEGDPALARFTGSEPSTATLVRMIHFMVRHFLRGTGADPAELDTRLRLVLQSWLDNGDYARELFAAIFERLHPHFAACLDAAAASGDLRPGPVASANSFWFGQHVAAMIAYMRLPGRSCAPYAGNPETLALDAAWFILRGIGVKDEAISAALAANAAPTAA